MRDTRKVTIRDVARRAGVARATVSQALGGKRPVSAATRERVLAAVRELGYQPNATARSLALRQTRTIGLALPLHPSGALPEGPFFGFIAGAADRLAQHDYKLLCVMSRDPRGDDVASLASAGHVDGMLLLQVRRADPRVAALRAAGLPFVAIGRPRDAAGLARVDADLVRAATVAVDHLYALGHRRIALLTASMDGLPVYGFGYYALVGFRHAHRAHGLPFNHTQVLSYDPADGPGAALPPLVDGANGFTAVITTTDYEAATALHALISQGRCVPGDVSLVTLGDSVLTALAQPPITVVRFSVADETRLAVDMLIELLAGRQPQPLERIVPVEFLPRGSVGPVSDRFPSRIV